MTTTTNRGALVVASPALPAPTVDVPALLAAFLDGRSEHTARAYGRDLAAFAAFLGVPTVDDAARVLLAQGHGAANACALAYRAHLTTRGLSSAAINRHLSALRSLVKLARTLGLVPWRLEVGGVRATRYRDTRGPGRQGVARLLDALAARQGPKAARDRAIVRLLYAMALRRGEVAALDVAHVDLVAGTLAVRGKGHTERAPLTMPPGVTEALRAWLAVRGEAPGPLFCNFDRARKGGRLTTTSLYRVVRELGRSVGLVVRPHGLRHAAITDALDLTNGNFRSVQRFSRHADPRTLMRYDDNRQDLGGEIARLVESAEAATHG